MESRSKNGREHDSKHTNLQQNREKITKIWLKRKKLLLLQSQNAPELCSCRFVAHSSIG